MKIVPVTDLTKVGGGFLFEMNGKKNYMTDDIGKPVTVAEAQKIIDQLNTQFQVEWLPEAIYLLPYRLRKFYNDYGWERDYDGETHYGSHLVVGAQKNPIETEHTIIHEIGHLIFYHLVSPDRWQEWLRLRNMAQTDGQPWKDRPSEVFAEDFYYLFGGSEAKNYKYDVYDGTPDRPSPEVREWFLSLAKERGIMRTFKTINPAQIQDLTISRSITAIHIHHTWRPRKTDYVGEPTVRAMWRYHTAEKGWEDIGQHFSVAPDGVIWDGRDINKDPASVQGHNPGAIAIEMIGDFDKGQEQLVTPQREATVQLVLALLKKTGLTTKSIYFHRELDGAKTCPGTGIDKHEFVSWVEAWLKAQPKKDTLINQVIDDEADVFLDGKYLGKAPIIKGVSYFPTRAGGENLGFKVGWQPGKIDLTSK